MIKQHHKSIHNLTDLIATHFRLPTDVKVIDADKSAMIRIISPNGFIVTSVFCKKYPEGWVTMATQSSAADLRFDQRQIDDCSSEYQE